LKREGKKEKRFELSRRELCRAESEVVGSLMGYVVCVRKRTVVCSGVGGQERKEVFVRAGNCVGPVKVCGTGTIEKTPKAGGSWWKIAVDVPTIATQHVKTQTATSRT
jgi:hypothetical protein